MTEPGVFKDWSQMGLAEAELVTVSRYAVSVGDLVVVCSDAPAPIDDFLAPLADGEKEEKEEPAKKKPKINHASISADMLAQHPWLADHMKPQRAKAAGAAASSGDMDDPAEDAGDVLDEIPVGEVLDDDDLERLYKALEAKRVEWDIHTSEVFADRAFKVMVCKGAACRELTGLDYDAVRAYASGAVAKWCERYNMQAAKRFNILLYEEHNAFTLAKAWCSKMGHLYSIYMDLDEEDYRFTDADCESWDMPAEYKELLPKLTPKQAKEGRFMLNIRPRL